MSKKLTAKKSIREKVNAKKQKIGSEQLSQMNSKQPPRSFPRLPAKFRDLEILESFMSTRDLEEVVYHSGSTELRLKRIAAGSGGSSSSRPVSIRTMDIDRDPISGRADQASALPGSPGGGESASAVKSQFHVVKSPFVGTFYRTPGPNEKPFVEPGTFVKKGDVLGIVEAMKLMNEIESDAKGRVVRVLVESGTPVEFGEPLVEIDPAG